MVWIVFFVTVLLIIPFFITVYGCYFNEEKRLYFALYLFGFIKIISGYVKTRSKGGFYIHLSDNIAFIIDYTTIKKLSGGPDLFSYVQLQFLYLVIDCGIKNAKLLFIINSILVTLRTIAKISTNDGKITKITTDMNVYDTQESLKFIKIKTVLCFNAVCILQSLIANAKNIGEKYVKRKKKEFKRVYS